MSKLTSNYKLLSNLDLARNDLFNVSKIVGNQYDNLGKDLEITTWDADTAAGDLVLHAGVNLNDSTKSGRIFLFAGKENTSAGGLFSEDTVLNTYGGDKNIYQGIQLNPDSSISAYSLNNIKAIGEKSVSLISGNVEATLIAKDGSEKTSEKTPTLKINTSKNGSEGFLDIKTSTLKVVSTGVNLTYGSLAQIVGPENNPYYSLNVAESTTSGVYSKEIIDSITVNKNLALGSNSTFTFSGGTYTLNSIGEVDIDAKTSINIDSAKIYIGNDTTTIDVDGSKETQETNQKLAIYSRANDFKLEAGLDSQNPRTSTLQVTNANINGNAQVYGKITLGKNTSGTEYSGSEICSEISVSKKLILEAPEFNIKYSNTTGSILSGTSKDGTTINATTVNVTKLISATELNASGDSAFEGNVTIEDLDNKKTTEIKSSIVSVSNDSGSLNVSEKIIKLSATELTSISTTKAEYKLNKLTSRVTGDVTLANESTYKNQAGKGIANNASEYAYKVVVTGTEAESETGTTVSNPYTAAVTTHTLEARTSINTPLVQATDRVEASKLYVGGKYWVYYDADTSSLVFSKVS